MIRYITHALHMSAIGFVVLAIFNKMTCITDRVLPRNFPSFDIETCLYLFSCFLLFCTRPGHQFHGQSVSLLQMQTRRNQTSYSLSNTGYKIN